MTKKKDSEDFKVIGTSHKFKLGQWCKVIDSPPGKRSGHGFPLNTKVQIAATFLTKTVKEFPYQCTKEDSSYRCSFFEEELVEAITIKAYAYKKDNEFHWFNTEKNRAGFERFPTHDLEKLA